MAALTWSRSALNPSAFAPVGPVTTSGLTQATARMLGRATAGTGAIEELDAAASRALIAAAASGLATASGLTINTAKFLARATAGVGALEEFDFIVDTFTPTATFATVGDLSVSYAVQTGSRVKIGPLNFVNIALDFTPTYTTATGEFRIAGLPVAGSSRAFGAIVPFTNPLTFPASCTMLAWEANNGVSYLRLLGFGSAQQAVALTQAQFSSGVNKVLTLSGCYRSAA